MLCMNDDEMEAFLDLIQKGSAFSDYEAEDFSFLIVGGYVGFAQNLELAVPEAVVRVFETINTKIFRKKDGGLSGLAIMPILPTPCMV